MPFLFIFGLGFSGRAIARAALACGWRVEGSVRDPAQHPFADARVHRFDENHPVSADALAGVTHVIGSVPPTKLPSGEIGDPVLEWMRANGPFPDLQWVGYLSTTGVYGDHQGGWVDETSSLAGGLGRSRRRIMAEQDWLSSGFPVQVFRLGGIYGPGRSPLDQLRAGTARRIMKPGQVFGRIHVEDIARVVMASIARPNSGAIYNVVDDEPSPPWEVVEYAAKLLGVDPPPIIPWEKAKEVLSPMALSFYEDNKRVANGRIKTELAVDLTYPTYRQGLQSLL